MPLQLPNSLAIRDESPRTYEALVQVTNAINQGHAVAGVDATGVFTQPVNTGQLTVVEANGIFDATITDPSPQRQTVYFLEWDLQASFATARQIQLGASRYWRGMLGNIGNSYWRFAKQAQGSNISEWINFGGTTPKAVSSSGTAGPAPGVPAGSGSSSRSGQGFGPIGAS